MKRPSINTMILGHPVVSIPLFLVAGFFGFETFNGNAPPLVGVAALLAAAALSRCSRERRRYLAWQREWNALDPGYRPPRPLRHTARWVGAIGFLAALAYLPAAFADPNSPARTIAVLGVAALAFLWIARRVFGRRRKPRAAHDWIVTQAVTRSVAAPSAREAYARLPDYCRDLLTR